MRLRPSYVFLTWETFVFPLAIVCISNLGNICISKLQSFVFPAWETKWQSWPPPNLRISCWWSKSFGTNFHFSNLVQFKHVVTYITNDTKRLFEGRCRLHSCAFQITCCLGRGWRLFCNLRCKTEHRDNHAVKSWKPGVQRFTEHLAYILASTFHKKKKQFSWIILASGWASWKSWYLLCSWTWVSWSDTPSEPSSALRLGSPVLLWLLGELGGPVRNIYAQRR